MVGAACGRDDGARRTGKDRGEGRVVVDGLEASTTTRSRRTLVARACKRLGLAAAELERTRAVLGHPDVRGSAEVGAVGESMPIDALQARAITRHWFVPHGLERGGGEEGDEPLDQLLPEPARDGVGAVEGDASDRRPLLADVVEGLLQRRPQPLELREVGAFRSSYRSAVGSNEAPPCTIA
jgi:hypothetical protein